MIMKTLHTIYNNFAKRNLSSLRLLLVMLLTLTVTTNAWGAEDDTYDFPQNISVSLNKCATFDDIELPEQDYPIKEVRITYAYNKSASPKAIVTIDNEEIGTKSFTGTGNLTTYNTLIFSLDSPLKGSVIISNISASDCSGTGKGTLKITNVTLVEGAPAAPAAPCTVTLMDDNSTLTQSSAGESVTLPPRNGCDGYEFVGWTKSWYAPQTSWTTTAPTIIPAGSYTPTGDENLYPVYTKTEGGGTSYQFQQVTALSQIKAGGTFIITNGSYYLPNTQASSSGPLKADMVEVTNGVVTGTVTDAMKWTFSEAADDGKITIKSAANSTHYLYTTSDNNGLRVNNTSDTWTFEEYTVSDILGFAMKSTSNSRYCAVYTDGSDWRSYTTKNAGNYETNSGRLDLYKYTEISSSTTYYISVPDCDPCNALQAPNVTAKNITTNSFTLSWAAVAGATSYNIYNYTTNEGYETTDLTYTFNGLDPNTEYEWEVEAVSATCDGKGTTGTTTTLETYTITWKNADGTVLETDENVPHGTTPTYNGVTPTKTATEQYNYTFSGWSPEVYAADKDQIYTAQFDETTRQYTVTFNANGHGSAPDQQSVDYGTTATEPTAPTAFGYTFGGWYKEAGCTNVWDFATDVVTGNITLYAQWTEKALTRYRTDCDACIPLDGFAKINGTYHFFPGETITLTVTPPADDVPYTYQWQKLVDSDWTDIAGATATTYTKAEATIEDVGHYRCVVSSEGYCDLTPEFDVKCLQLYVYYDNKSDVFNAPLKKVDGATATISVDLQNANYTYYFKITDGCGNWYGNTGIMNRDNCTDWSMNADAYCGLETTKFGTYVFNVNYSDLTKLTVSVLYPSAYQAAGKVIYLDNNVLNWTHSNNAEGKNKIYYRIGRSNHNSKTAMTKVPGTANLYKVTTGEYDNFEVWHIANNGCWSEDNSIFKTKTGDDGWAATQATAFETLPVTLAAVTVTPTTLRSVGGVDENSNCEFYNYDITEGMKTWKAQVVEPTNGTITVKYTHHDGTAVNDFTSGTRDLAHTCLLTITATADPGYSLTSLTVNDVPFTSGNVHTLTANAVIKAEFTINTHVLTWNVNGGNSLTGEYTQGSVDYGTPIVQPADPTRAGHTFKGWIDQNGQTTVQTTMPDYDLTYTAQWKLIPTLSWSAPSCTAALEADNDYPKLTTSPADLTGITYSSSDESVATIDDNTGEITLVGVGETTVTASFAGNGTYAPAADASYTLIVVASNCRWVEVTDNTTLEDGDEVVITMSKGRFTWTISNTKNTSTTAPTANDITANIQGKYLTTVSDEYKWVIEKENANLTFYSYINNANYLYCTNADNGNGVRVGTGAAKVFVVDGNYLKNIETTSPRYLGVSLNTVPYSWRCYTSTTSVIEGETLKFYKRECLDSEHYWVTWDAGEGTWEDGSTKKLESYQVGATITAPTENPTREGYRFDGWTPAPTTMPAQNTTFTAVWTEVYKITWYENGVPSYTEVPSDNPVVTWEDDIADCGEKKFYGWTADDSFVSDPTTPPTLISKGTTIAGDVTYYAVYADAVEPAIHGYTKVTTISAGTYLIAAPSKNIAYKAVTSDVPAVISNNVISSLPEGATELLVELGTNTNAGYFAISYNNNGTKTYIYGADKDLKTTNTATYDWALDADNATLGEIQSKSKSGYYIQANNTNGDFKAYAHTQTVSYLYKKQTTTYKNFAVSCATYTISVITPTGGTVTTNPADEAGAGQEITINVTPDDCKYLTALKYNDGSDHSINISSTPYTFTMPAADVTVTATFADKTATDIEILTSAHRMLMQGSAFVGEQVRITYNNGDKETLNCDDSRLTFTGHNTATLGSQTVTVTYNGCGTQSASYNIEVIDGLGITFWDGDYTETIKYEPGDLVDVDNKIGQNICLGWEFAGWSETKVANESNGFTPVHNFNATDAKVLYAVYVETSTDWISAYNIDELHSGAKYVIVAHYADSKEYALTNTNNTNSSYLDGANLTTDCEQVREGDAYPYKDRYKLKVTSQPSWKWQLVNTGSGWTMRNISANKYLKINTDESISLTTTPDDKFTLSNGSNDSEITAQSSSNNYLSWYNSSKYWNGHTSGHQYYLTNETNFTSTPPCSPLSATFHGNGGIVTDGVNSGDDLTITEPTRDAGITTPTASFADCNGKSWTFVGWAREEIDVTRVPVLTTDLLHDGGGNKQYEIQEDGEDFWAVYTNQGTPETKYGTITFTKENFPNTYDNISKSCTIVENGDSYNFYYTNVAKPSGNSIQIQEGKGYLTNTTSLGKINSISFTNFIYGNINCLKVSLGTSADALTTVLTAEELQVVDGVYTYYPKANYSFFKIESIEDAGAVGIETISIDFGKGTQIWATTPDCSTITLSGDELYVTSTNGQSIRAAERLTVKAVQLESKAKVVISSNSSDIYFSDVQDANFTQAVKPTETLTLTTDVDGNLSATEIYVHYRPSVDGTGIPEDVVVSANLETPNPGITDDHTIHVRNLPATFAIVAKVGDVWYALPSQGLNSTTPPAAYPVEVDDMADPTAVVSVPANADWSLRQVYTSSGSKDRFADNGEKLVFVNDANPQKALNAGSTGNYLLTDAQYEGYHNTINPSLYEWTPTTTDLETYTLTNAQRTDRTLNVATNTVFGVHDDNKATTEVRFLPIQDRYTPLTLQVVEWKENSVVVMYNGDPAQTASVSVNGAAAQNTTLSDSDAERDIAVYELAATGLAANPAQRLSITIGTEKVILSIPYIINSETTDEAVLLGSSVAAPQEVAKVSDLVILKGATLTAAGAKSNPYKFRNVTVYGGGKLVVPAENGFGVNSLTLRAGGVTADGYDYVYDYVYPQFVLNGTWSNTSGKINLDYLTTKEQYYTFVAPFEVQTQDIHYPVDIYGNNVAANNTGSFEFEYYDGATRATGVSGWKTVEEGAGGATLEPGQGYTFLGMPKKVSVNGGSSTRQKFGIHRIPMTVTAEQARTHENSEQTITVAPHSAEKNINAGWNLIGNPYMSTITGLNNESIQTGTIVWEDNKWEWSNDGTSANRFIVFPSNDGQWYTTSQASNATLPAFKNFFVQIIDDKAVNALVIPLTSRTNPSAAPARHAAEEIDRDIELAIVLEKDEQNADQMDFLLNNTYGPAFDRNADFTKMMNNTNFNLYGVHMDDCLSFVAIDQYTAAQPVAIGYQVPTAGEYMLRMSDKPYVMADRIKALYVTDHEMTPEVTTDILKEPYRFTVGKAETNHTRFTISIELKPNTGDGVTTGWENVDVGKDQPIKFIYQDKLYILRNGVIYDATGKFVQTINK